MGWPPHLHMFFIRCAFKVTFFVPSIACELGIINSCVCFYQLSSWISLLIHFVYFFQSSSAFAISVIYSSQIYTVSIFATLSCLVDVPSGGALITLPKNSWHITQSLVSF